MKIQDMNWANPGDRWSFINTQKRINYEAYVHVFKEWFLAIQYYKGKQGYYINYNGELTQTKVSKHEVAAKNNQLMPMARKFTSDMARIEPVWGVLPATNSQEDIEVSQQNTDILHSYWQKLKLYRVYLRSLYWVVTTGNCFLKCIWDPEAGAPIGIPDSDILIKQLQEILGTTRSPDLNIGDNAVSITSPFNLILQNGVAELQDSMFSIESSIQDIAAVEDRYGVTGLNSDNNISMSGAYYLQMASKERNSTDMRNKCVVYDVHVKPNKFNKKGSRFIMCQGKDLKPPTKFPYSHGMLPYAHLGEVYCPGELYYLSTLGQNVRSQQILNRIDSQITQYGNQMLKGQWLIPTASKTPANSINDAPGAIIPYIWPFKPEQRRMMSLPRTIFDHRNNIIAGMRDTANAHDPSRGQAAGSVRAAELARELKESDLAVLGPTTIDHDEALQDIGKMILSNASQYAKEERLASVTRNGRLKVTRSFTGDMLQGSLAEQGVDYFNVYISHSGRAPWNKLYAEQTVAALTKMGYLRPGEHDQIVLKTLGYEDARPLFEVPDQGRHVQLQENKLLDQGQEVIVGKHNHHASHIEAILLHIESDVWNELSPESQQAYYKHLDQHRQAAAVEEVLPEVLRQMAVLQLSGPLGMNNNANSNRGRTEQDTGA